MCWSWGEQAPACYSVETCDLVSCIHMCICGRVNGRITRLEHPFLWRGRGQILILPKEHQCWGRVGCREGFLAWVSRSQIHAARAGETLGMSTLNKPVAGQRWALAGSTLHWWVMLRLYPSTPKAQPSVRSPPDTCLRGTSRSRGWNKGKSTQLLFFLHNL